MRKNELFQNLGTKNEFWGNGPPVHVAALKIPPVVKEYIYSFIVLLK